MKTLIRGALSIGAATLIAGCGGSQMAAPATSARNSRADGISHPLTSSWYQVLYRFKGGDGSTPVAPLTHLNGALYGTTESGGEHCHRPISACGTVFSITKSGKLRFIYKFDPWQSGAYPKSGLTDLRGTLYGTTTRGGNAAGTVYTISRSGVESVLYEFKGGSDGADPAAPLLNVNGTLYGTTAGGGVRRDRYYRGTAYSITGSGVHTVLYSFKQPPDANYPASGLIEVNGTLYGTSEFGGSITSSCPSGCGTIYSITRGGVEKVVYRFTDSPDGAFPEGSLLKVNGTLYGTTVGGGNACGSGCGTVFSITTNGQENVLYNFTGGSDGENPAAGLINVNGTLYGTTAGGGSGVRCGYGCGTIFSVTTAGVETVLYRFAGGTDGWSPLASLLDVKGTLYGTTPSGGRNKGRCCGVVFALTP